MNGIIHRLNYSADYIPRPRTYRFAVYDENGNKVDIACGFEGLKSGESSEAAVFAVLPDNTRIPVRICVKRKDEEACGQSWKRPAHRASRKGNTLREKTAAFNERITVVTSLPNSVTAGTGRLGYVSRVKPILDFGDVPKKNPAASESRPNGKTPGALLNEAFVFHR